MEKQKAQKITKVQITDFGSREDHAWSVKIQGDGKIVVGGSTGADFAIARYNSDGSPDSSFSKDGKQKTNFGPLLLVILPQ